MIYRYPPEIIWIDDEYYHSIFVGNALKEWTEKASFEVFLQDSKDGKQIIVNKRRNLLYPVNYLRFYFKHVKVVLDVRK